MLSVFIVVFVGVTILAVLCQVTCRFSAQFLPQNGLKTSLEALRIYFEYGSFGRKCGNL